MEYIDLTHKFINKMPTYPGDPEVELIQTAFIEKQGYNDFQIKSGMHVGTHIDAPLHMLENGKKMSDYPVDKFFGNGYLIDARDKKEINAELLKGASIKKGDIVLIITGFDKKFSDKKYFESYPIITNDFANKLVELDVSIVGMDTPSPDNKPFNIHKILLKENILIIENLTNLESLLGAKSFQIAAMPMNIEAEASPARVIATIN